MNKMQEDEILDLIDRHMDVVSSDIQETIKEMRESEDERPRLLKEIYALKHKRKSLHDLKEEIENDES